MRLDGARIVIAGGTSAIAGALTRCLLAEGCRVHLLARNQEKLEKATAELNDVFPGRVTSSLWEALDFDGYGDSLKEAVDHLGGMDGLVVAVGDMGDEGRVDSSPEAARHVLRVNLEAPVSLFTLAAHRMVETGQGGFLMGISSVAGDRGRASRGVYGAAKAGLTNYLSALRNRLHSHGVKVLTVKPGPVASPMTAGKKVALVAQPEQIAPRLIEAIKQERDEIYVPWFWGPIMAVIRHLPEPLFKRLNL